MNALGSRQGREPKLSYPACAGAAKPAARVKDWRVGPSVMAVQRRVI